MKVTERALLDHPLQTTHSERIFAVRMISGTVPLILLKGTCNVFKSNQKMTSIRIWQLMQNAMLMRLSVEKELLRLMRSFLKLSRQNC